MYFLSFGSIEYAIYIFFLPSVHPIISVIFALSSITRGLPFSTVNHISMNENYLLVVFNIVSKWGDK